MDAGPCSSPAWLWRLRHALVLVLFGAVALNTDTGRILGDTKIDLVLDPGAFLARALHLGIRRAAVVSCRTRRTGISSRWVRSSGSASRWGCPAG